VPIDPTPTALTTEERIKRLAQFARRAVAGTIQARMKSRQRSEVEIYLVVQMQATIILVFVAQLIINELSYFYLMKVKSVIN
jgi:hypothetical protein